MSDKRPSGYYFVKVDNHYNPFQPYYWNGEKWMIPDDYLIVGDSYFTGEILTAPITPSAIQALQEIVWKVQSTGGSWVENPAEDKYYDIKRILEKHNLLTEK